MKDINYIINGIDKLLTFILIVVMVLVLLSGMIGGCIYLWKIILGI